MVLIVAILTIWRYKVDNGTNNKVAIIDFQMGNLFSVNRACEDVGLAPLITSDPAAILSADAVILPGVGAFGDAMNNLKILDIVDPLKDFISSGKPFLGICLGLQLLMSESSEFGRYKGLDIIKGAVVKFPETIQEEYNVKVPQVGWNKIYRPSGENGERWQNSMLSGIRDTEYMYFVHSYYVVPEDSSIVLSNTNYEGTEYSSSICLNNVFACQFHPEKSSNEGMKIYKNFSAQLTKNESNYE